MKNRDELLDITKKLVKVPESRKRKRKSLQEMFDANDAALGIQQDKSHCSASGRYDADAAI